MRHNNAPGGQDLELADAIEALRTELERALAEGPHHQLRFRISDITLTLQTVARKSTGGKLGIGWYVLSAGANASSEGIATQTLVLNLTPLVAQLPAPVVGDGDVAMTYVVAEAEVDANSQRAEPFVIDLKPLSDEYGDVFAVVKVPGMQLPTEPGNPRYVPPLFLAGSPVVELDPALHGPAITHIADAIAAHQTGTEGS